MPLHPLTSPLPRLSLHFPLLVPSKTHESSSALYLRHDPYETSDAVFGVKSSLLVDLATVNATQAKQYNIEQGSKLLTYDFVLVSEKEARELREKKATEAMKGLGRRMKLLDGLPVPDVD